MAARSAAQTSGEGGVRKNGDCKSPQCPAWEVDGLVDVERFVEGQLALLGEEREAEMAEVTAQLEGVGYGELERRGIALCRLMIARTSTGMYGRTVVRFERGRGPVRELPATKLGPGDIVQLSVMEDGGKRPVASGLSPSSHPRLDTPGPPAHDVIYKLCP